LSFLLMFLPPAFCAGPLLFFSCVCVLCAGILKDYRR
jgi:hypothetical protein